MPSKAQLTGLKNLARPASQLAEVTENPVFGNYGEPFDQVRPCDLFAVLLE
jgi:hypothetical protein